MSSSVEAKGTVAKVKTVLTQQFSYPLADGAAGLADESEKETVRRVRDTIFQCLDTFDPTYTVGVRAYGHMGWKDYATKQGAYQKVNVAILGG